MKKLLAILLASMLLVCGCSKNNISENNAGGVSADSKSEEQKITVDLFAMDTYMQVTAYGKNANKAVEQAKKRINQLDGMLSTGKKESEVSKLNSEKTLTLSEDVGNIMERSLEIYKSTKGVFNPAIYPVMQAWGFDTKKYKVPSKENLQATLKNTDASKIKYNKSSRVATFENKKMEIDFGGIAKGYTSAAVMMIFKDCGVTSGLVSLGGNVQALGSKVDGSSWKVAIQNPDSEENYLGVLNIKNKAVITSGGYERYFEKNGKVYHHIIDPATGYPANAGLKSVTIVSEDGTLADGLSTSLFIMGLEKAENYWRENSDKFDVIFLTDDNKQYVTEGIYKDYSSDNKVIKITKDK